MEEWYNQWNFGIFISVCGKSFKFLVRVFDGKWTWSGDDRGFKHDFKK